ncbi:amidohydrolase [Croceiramulus getboli]|nr:amidohydrolase [Flavobacteriaceae bacterium YJPT1-3]
MKHTLLSLVCLAVLLFSCQSKESVDLIVTDANVYTVNDAFAKAEAFAVKDGQFVAVGSNAEILEAYEASEIMNAEGKTVLPGLIDAHCHFYRMGLGLQIADLTGTQSFQEILDILVAFGKERQPEFILGRGWDQNDWEVKEFPTKKELDELFPDTPVAITRVDGHAMLVNQKALDLAGIDATTQVEGGAIEKENGILTGILVDNPMGMVRKVIPETSRQTAIQALKDAEQLCFQYGLTTVDDAGLSRPAIELIDSLQQAGNLKMRVYAMISNTPADRDYYLDKGIFKTDRLNVRSFKVYGDGALGSRGAAMREPYSDKPGHYGAMVTPIEQINDLAQRLAASEFQMNTHAIGDSANIAVLRAYEEVLSDQEDRRWRVEHAQIISMEDFDYYEQGIIPSIQPTHATSDMYWAEDRVGEERMQGAYAFQTLLEKAGLVALGTDFPVERVNPFHTFYASVARKDLEQYPEGGFQPEQKLTREQTLRGMTIWAAYSNFEEQEKGSIEVGKLADFVIMEEDIMTVPEDRIPNLAVSATYVGGQQVYKAN